MIKDKKRIGNSVVVEDGVAYHRSLACPLATITQTPRGERFIVVNDEREKGDRESMGLTRYIGGIGSLLEVEVLKVGREDFFDLKSDIEEGEFDQLVLETELKMLANEKGAITNVK